MVLDIHLARIQQEYTSSLRLVDRLLVDLRNLELVDILVVHAPLHLETRGLQAFLPHLDRLFLGSLEDVVDILILVDGTLLPVEDFVSAVRENCLELLVLQVVVGVLRFYYETLPLKLDHLSLADLLFDSIFGDKPVDSDLSCLADSVRAVDCLEVHHGVEIAVVDDNAVGAEQVDSEATGSRGEQEYENIAALPLEGVHLFPPVNKLRFAIYPAASVLSESAVVLDDIQKAHEL